jgi:23S rRNA pseudouridine1911/1915/1917 synthase
MSGNGDDCASDHFLIMEQVIWQACHTNRVKLTSGEQDAGKRLDHFLQERLPQFSRSRLQEWIKAGHVTVNESACKSSMTLRGGEAIEVQPADPPPLHAQAEDIPLDILYEDDAVIAVNKPAGVVVHAGAGNHTGTLTNALLHHFGTLSTTGGPLRPGIVHRIDRYTSGVLLVARTDAAHRALAEQFAQRTVEKTYLTLVHGTVAAESGRVTTPIMRDPVKRTRMTTRLEKGRTALTTYRVQRRFDRFTFLEVKIGTGRTHQIRVHLSSIRHPVAGDTLYGAPRSEHGRYFLHAWRVAFDSPTTGERIEVTAPLPNDLEAWLAALQ